MSEQRTIEQKGMHTGKTERGVAEREAHDARSSNPSDERLSIEQHVCARILFDGEPCDMPEHQGASCPGCTPYVHSDLSMDHEPTCSVCAPRCEVIVNGKASR